MKRSAITLAALVALASTSALADTWSVTQGKKGEATGTWQIEIRGDKVTGTGDMMTQGKATKLQISGTKSYEGFKLQSVAQGAPPCMVFLPRIEKAAVNGSVACGKEPPVPVLITPKK